MKNKTVAGVLALFAGYMGLHRFYLGQIGLGIAYIFLLPVAAASGFWFVSLIGVIDAIVLLSMDQDVFDDKYNNGQRRQRDKNTSTTRRRTRREYKEERNDYRNRRYEERYGKPSKKQESSANKSKSGSFLKSGKAKFKDYDYEEAITDFTKALELDPQSIAVHFNLACAHSLMEHKDKAFYHLDRAVALGFDDFDAIRTRDHLAYLRIQPEYLVFENNNFRLSKQLNSQQENLLDKVPTAANNTNTDLLAQLQQLASLKERGLLTEDEFRKQKEKLLH